MTRYVRDFSGAGISKPRIALDSNGYVQGHPTWLYQVHDGAGVPLKFLP